MNKIVFLVIVFVSSLSSFSQTFPPSPGVIGSTSIKKDSSIIVAWANGIVLERGVMNRANPSAGNASFGEAENAIKPNESTTFDVVSLGDSGVAVLTFDRAIRNDVGPDFTVFENGFQDGFIELAFVEVSSDGENFFRFPAVSQAPILVQVGAFEISDCRYFNNLAGKYRVGYGTPFDLEELKGTVGLDLSLITHVKLIDVIGSIDPLIGSKDSQGTMINDLFPTEFASGGFDLDAVGVIHQAPLSVDEFDLKYSIFPNPTNGLFSIKSEGNGSVRVLDITGKVVFNQTFSSSVDIDLSSFESNCYFVEISNSTFRKVEKLVKF